MPHLETLKYIKKKFYEIQNNSLKAKYYLVSTLQPEHIKAQWVSKLQLTSGL